MAPTITVEQLDAQEAAYHEYIRVHAQLHVSSSVGGEQYRQDVDQIWRRLEQLEAKYPVFPMRMHHEMNQMRKELEHDGAFS